MNVTSISSPSTFHPGNFRPATGEDLSILVSRMREECSAECRAINGIDPLTSLMADRDNTYIFVGKNGLPTAAVSISPAGDDDCAILIRVADDIKVNITTFVPSISKFCMELHGQYKNIHALVDVRNVPTAVLLRDCGFVFVRRFDRFGHEQRPFNLYTSKRSCSNPYH